MPQVLGSIRCLISGFVRPAGCPRSGFGTKKRSGAPLLLDFWYLLRLSTPRPPGLNYSADRRFAGRPRPSARRLVVQTRVNAMQGRRMATGRCGSCDAHPHLRGSATGLSGLLPAAQPGRSTRDKPAGLPTRRPPDTGPSLATRHRVQSSGHQIFAHICSYGQKLKRPALKSLFSTLLLVYWYPCMPGASRPLSAKKASTRSGRNQSVAPLSKITP